MADTHGNPSRSIARASRAGVSVTQQGDKMHDNNNNNDTRTNAIMETFRFIAHYERLIDTGIDFDVTDRSAELHEDGRAINLYCMLQDFKDALSGDLEWEAEE